jgi:hypothetical protein
MKSIRQFVLPRLDRPGDRMGPQAEADGPASLVPRAAPATRIDDETARSVSTKVRLVIFVDEIDFVRSLPFSTDEFFAAIRECYNHRTRDSTYEQVTFCLLGVFPVRSDPRHAHDAIQYRTTNRVERFQSDRGGGARQGLEDANPDIGIRSWPRTESSTGRRGTHI